jgi:thymidine phosphorylase
MTVHLRAQGSDIADLYARAEVVASAHTQRVTANTSGFLRMNLESIRTLLVELQRAHSGDAFPDPAGVRLCYPSGSFVERGAVIATARGLTSPDGSRRLEAAFSVEKRPVTIPGFEQVADDGV